MTNVKNLSIFRKVLVDGQAPAIPIPNYSQEHAVPVPLTLTLSVTGVGGFVGSEILTLVSFLIPTFKDE